MGYVSIILLSAVTAISWYILTNRTQFPASVITSAAVALFVDVLGLLAGVWKIVLNPASVTRLAPTTKVSLTRTEPQQKQE
jgi:hypothetical protein